MKSVSTIRFGFSLNEKNCEQTSFSNFRSSVVDQGSIEIGSSSSFCSERNKHKPRSFNAFIYFFLSRFQSQLICTFKPAFFSINFQNLNSNGPLSTVYRSQSGLSISFLSSRTFLNFFPNKFWSKISKWNKIQIMKIVHFFCSETPIDFVLPLWTELRIEKITNNLHFYWKIS